MSSNPPLNSFGYHVMTRPYGYSEKVRRQAAEWQFHAAAIEALAETYSIPEYRVTGHSGGGHLAVTLGQKMEGVTCAVASASILAVKEQYRNNDGFIPRYVRTQHDASEHPLPEGVTFGLIYNPNDPILSKFGIYPFLERQAKNHNVVRANILKDIEFDSFGKADLFYLETKDKAGIQAHMEPMLYIRHLFDRICIPPSQGAAASD